ncbi:transcription initiation protein [Arthrobacter sp. CDRTa11]|uniref:YciI family protein n=1 Tax=Arthrobacter sp. CDRTa11 TaxID=2651199 RepID=UPI002265A965|nr:YciI family protein [Arthrobacter sp. CDRTa11]UZX03290.1 transcription initiation protein [Arthrobacter sp. CDRTa11]
MKYMIMMFGSAEGMMETADPAWIQEMIGFMIQIDKDLTESGELVFNAGLADGSTAKTVKQAGNGVITTDGPYAESKESLIGYWVVDVASEQRAIDICSSIVKYAGAVELRAVQDGPPDV